MINRDNENIDELLAGYLLNETSPELRAQVEQWIETDTANRKYFEHFRLIWEASRDLDPAINIDEKQAWNRFRARAERMHKPQAVVAPFSRHLAKLRVAAGIIITISALTLGYFLLRKTATPVVIASGNLAMADTLPDGSVVTLNKHSQIAYPSRFDQDTRNVSLEGEAFFTVTPNRKKPFIIHVNDVVITVVGTEFNVRSANGNTEVIVESGTVKVKKNNSEKILTKGQKLTAAKKDPELKEELNTDELYSYYRSKEFVCDNTPLWKLVTVLNEAYDSHIIIENKSLRNLPLTTTFSNESLDHVLDIVSETFNIKVERRQDTIVLK